MLVGDQAIESTLVNALRRRPFGLKLDVERAIIREVALRAAGWKVEFSAKGVAARDIDLLAQYIDGDRLRRQREEFLSR